MKHNGFANLFLGIIYGAILASIHTSIEAPASIGLMTIAILFMGLFTYFLYLAGED